MWYICQGVCGLGEVVLILLGVGDESVSLMCLVCLLWLYGVVLDVDCGSWALEQGIWGGFSHLTFAISLLILPKFKVATYSYQCYI